MPTTPGGRGRLTLPSGNIYCVSASGTAGTGPPRHSSGIAGRSRAEQMRLLLAMVLGGLAVAFALLNLDRVEVDWILGTWGTPLIVVILVSLFVGMALGFTLARRGRRSARATSQPPADTRG